MPKDEGLMRAEMKSGREGLQTAQSGESLSREITHKTMQELK